MDYFVTGGQTKIAYTHVSGNDPTIVLVHGAMINSKEWQPQLDALAGRSYVLLDLPGHGQSERSDSQYSVSQFASCVSQLLDHLQIEPAIICGHSLGGMVAQQLAVDRPDLVAGLILADTSYGVRSTRIEALLTNGSRPLFNLIPVKTQASFIARQTGKHSPEVGRFLEVEIGAHADDKANYQRIWRAVTSFDGYEQLTKIDCKTLILVGKLNKQTHRQAKVMLARIPSAELVYIEQAGHMLNWDNPGRFNEVITHFADRIEAD